MDFQSISVGKGLGKNKIPYVKADADMGGITVLSASTAPHGSTNLANFMKKSPNSVSKTAYMDRSATLLATNLRQRGWTSGFIIVTPQSSSSLADEFAKILAAKFSGVTVIPKAFRKGKGSEIGVKEDAKGITPSIYKSLQDTINRFEKNSATIEAKKFNKRDLKFVSGLMVYQGFKNLNGSRVMIVDDVISSGSTMSSMYEELNSMGVNKTIGVTILKIGGN